MFESVALKGSGRKWGRGRGGDRRKERERERGKKES